MIKVNREYILLKKITCLIFVFFTISTFTFDLNSFFDVWMAYNNGNVVLSNIELEDYICTTSLNDEMMIKLFKTANKDWHKYNQLKTKWAKSRFKDGLKKFSYIQAIQDYSSSFKLDQKEKIPFRITNQEYKNKLTQMENQFLKPWLDAGSTLDNARSSFGAKLREVGYPHHQSHTDRGIFLLWYNLQKKRMKEGLRIQEVSKTEYMATIGKTEKLNVSSHEFHEFIDTQIEKISHELNNKRMTPESMEKILSEDDGLKVLIKSVSFIGPDTTSLVDIKNEAPAVFNDFVKNLRTKTLPSLNYEIKNKILNYDKHTATFIEKYKSKDKLNKLASEMRNKFVSGEGQFQHFMMSILYQLSALKLDYKSTDLKKEQSLKEEYLKALIFESVKVINTTMENPDEAKGQRLEDHFIDVINNSPSKSLKILADELNLNPYLRKFKRMANWVIKFQIKKASLTTIPKTSIELRDSTTEEGQAKIKEYLKSIKYQHYLADFRANKLREKSHFLTIAPSSHQRLKDSEAWNYILEQFEK